MMKENNQSILFITQLYPFPPDTGGKLKTFSTIKCLVSLGYKIRLFSFWDEDTPRIQTFDKAIPGVKAHIFTRSIIDSLHPVKKLMAFFLSIFSFTPYRVRKFYSSVVSSNIEKYLRSFDYGIIYADHLSSCKYLLKLKNFKFTTIYDAHNFESGLIYQRFFHSKSRLRKLILYIEYLKTMRFEREVLFSIGRIFSISPQVKDELESMSKRNISLMPIAMPRVEGFNNRIPKKEKIVVFVGSLFWEENLLGLQWFVSKVWNFILEKVPEVKFYIVGSYGNSQMEKKYSKYRNINYLGYQKDLRRVYQKISVGVAPIFSNSGVKMKVLDFMSHSIPVVSTSMGVSGILGIKNSINCYIANDPAEFARKITILLLRKDIRIKIATSARELIAQYYSESNLRKFLKSHLSQFDKNTDSS